ncbi:hypothetical protein N7492_002977 [Penicillium capsulatum]|uniref:F-box domain-containing protein n=1 Tax=Penicillium capsulatum TaxID=69766 RepID=A0A9W9LWX1_9EURO|nr:hypothetical protein N7492_002977 [Penicillium capsulatum]KAJ6122432.1 hypothetical protein N7512_004897 [Penicillium capsulatum]
MSFADLPSELLLEIARYLEYEIDINSLARTNRFFCQVLNQYTYKRLSENKDNRALEWAAREGKPDCVKRLLRAGLKACSLGEEGYTPFELSVKNGHIDVVTAFLEHDLTILHAHQEASRPYMKRHDRTNVLLDAIGSGNEAIVRVLINYGADIECLWEIKQKRPLSIAIRYRHAAIVTLLIENGCNPQDCVHGIVDARLPEEFPHQHGDRLLEMEFFHFLVDLGLDLELPEHKSRQQFMFRDGICNTQFPLVEFLMEKGYSPDKSAIQSLFVRIFTEGTGYPEMATLLPKLIDIDAIIVPGVNDDSKFRLVLELARCGLVKPMRHVLHRIQAVDAGIFDRADFSHKYKDTLNRSLMWAVVRGHLDMVKFLLGRRANLNGNESGDESPLSEAIHRKRDKISIFLLSKGADPFPKKSKVLINSIFEQGSLEVIQWLLDRKLLLPNRMVPDSILALRCAGNGNERVFDILLRLGFKLRPRVMAHRQEFLRSARFANVNILRHFLDAGFHVNAHDAFGGLAKDHRDYSDHILPGFNILVYAASAEDTHAAEKAVDFLLARGANIHFFGAKRHMFATSLLCLACVDGSSPILSAFPLSNDARVRAARLLLRKGAALDDFSRCGKSPLIAAARYDFKEMAKVILEFYERAQIPFEDLDDVRFILAPNVLHVPWFSDEWSEDESMVKDISLSETGRLIYRYYWRKRYPVA